MKIVLKELFGELHSDLESGMTFETVKPYEKDWKKWDKKIKLDFLIKEAKNEKNKGTLRKL